MTLAPTEQLTVTLPSDNDNELVEEPSECGITLEEEEVTSVNEVNEPKDEHSTVLGVTMPVKDDNDQLPADAHGKELSAPDDTVAATESQLTLTTSVEESLSDDGGVDTARESVLEDGEVPLPDEEVPLADEEVALDGEVVLTVEEVVPVLEDVVTDELKSTPQTLSSPSKLSKSRSIVSQSIGLPHKIVSASKAS